MDQDDPIGNVGLLLSIFFFIANGYKYYLYWNQLKDALTKTGAKWKMHDQKELNETAQTNIVSGYSIVAHNMGEAARIIFSMQSDDPDVRKALWGLCRTLMYFCLFPLIIGLVLLITAAMLAP